MKDKNFSKKLQLKKETVHNLNIRDMNGLRGGAIHTKWPALCESDEPICTRYCPNTLVKC
jgi:hypothetical protein